jgi:large subunit ribosomal protein L18
MLEKKEKRQRRHRKIRAKMFGTQDKPRLSVFRSAKHIYAQLINDEKRKTLVSASDSEIKKLKLKGKISKAVELGKLIAQKALDLPADRQGKKIEKVVFDRGGYKYHGRIKAVAEGAREGGLKF